MDIVKCPDCGEPMMEYYSGTPEDESWFECKNEECDYQED